MMKDFFDEKKQIQDAFRQEKLFLYEEFKVNKAIQFVLQQGKDKLLEELKEVKKIIKIPRMHFKYLEKMEYDGIMAQMKQLEEKNHKLNNSINHHHQLRNSSQQKLERTKVVRNRNFSSTKIRQLNSTSH